MRMPIKVTFKERMTGTLCRGDEKWQAEFNIVAVSDIKGRDLMKGEFPHKIKGRLEMSCPEGCCKESVPLRGYLIIDVLRRKLIYRFTFGHKGSYMFEGEKNVRFDGLRQYLDTMTYLPGQVCDSVNGEDGGPAEFRFNLKKDLLPMLLSFRIRI